MALTITGIPDSRAYLGISNQEDIKALAPGASDYPTGGYVITAALLQMSYLFGAAILGQNAAAVTAGYFWMIQAATANPPLAGLTQVTLQAFGITTGTPGTFVEAALNTNFAGVVITALFRGF